MITKTGGKSIENIIKVIDDELAKLSFDSENFITFCVICEARKVLERKE